jgi:two-component system sensor histidine kinase PilS (NtrC family)
MRVERRKLLVMIVLRAVVLALLLTTAVIVQSSTSSLRSLTAVYGLVVGYLALSLVFLALYFLVRAYQVQAFLQIFFDLILVTLLIYVAGGVQGSLHILYVLVILSASYFLSARAAYLVAALSAIFFGLLVEGLYYGLFPFFQPEQAKILSFASVLSTVVISWTLFFAVAYLVNSMSARLSRTREELALMQRALEVKESQAAAGRISAQIAHEIRNPLTAIAGAVQVLARPSGDEKERRELTRIVLTETERVSQTLEQFMDLVDPRKAAMESLDLSALLRETLVMIRRSEDLNGRVELRGNYLDGPVPYYGSPSQFKQVFWNLVKNALRAMSEGGALEMNFEPQESGGVRLRIADNGHGMTEEAKRKLFEPFHSGFESGRGLGMAVVRRVVDDYRGRIEVESAPGLGTSVTIDLPRPAKPAEREGPAGGRG